MRSAVLLFSFAGCLSAATIRGTVADPTGEAVPGAVIAAVNRVGLVAQTTSALSGGFELKVPDGDDVSLMITAPGFATRTVSPADAARIELEIAPLVDSVKVAGSAIDAPASAIPASISVVSAQELRQRNESQAVDLLRYLPGLSLIQTGPRGGVSGLFIRGGYPTFNLVSVDGVPVNTFGGNFDFAHIPAEALERIEVVRGPQSAVYGPYANSGVINFVTRSPESGPRLDVVAEGGTYRERRFGVTGAGMLAGWGIAASAGSLQSDGPVINSDYRDQNLLLNVTRRFGTQSLAMHASFLSNEVGRPGPWGSDPKHVFSGIDTIGRDKNNVSDYFLHYTVDATPRLRGEVIGTFFLGNSGYNSQYGYSFDQNLRGQGEARMIASVSRRYTTAFGVVVGREEVRNSYITDAAYSVFPLRRKNTAVYWENRFEFGRLSLSAGARGEFISTPAIPGDGYSRPFFPDNQVNKVNPKFAAAYALASSTRAHVAFGLGVRPPTGFELAYTNNPRLRPERTRSVETGIEQTLWHNRVSLDATYFYNRFYDLIVTLGGSLTPLSRFQSDNLANSRAQGAEFSARVRPARWAFLAASYTRLDTEVLSLDGGNGLAPRPYQPGQQLVRRPANSGSIVASFTRGRVTADVTGYFRGDTLDIEPNYGATNGLFRNPGYANAGLNLNYTLRRGLTAYGSLRNALNQHYEEVYGFPSPRLNFVTGVRWTLTRAQ